MFLKEGHPMESTLNKSALSQAIGLLIALGALGSSAAFAQVQPDAGSLMTIPAAPMTAPPKAPVFEIQQDVRPALVVPGGVKVKVNGFKVTGNTAYPSAELENLLSLQVGKELDLAGLDEAASLISQYYRNHGYFVARAYLPAQEVASGNIEISVIEGRLGAVKLERKGETRLMAEVAQGIVADSAPIGSPIKDTNIERGLMLLNDLPGVEVKSTLVPGASVGTSDLVVETTQGALLNGSVDADNYGNKFTGAARVGGTVNINDPSGRGDQVILRGMASGLGGSSNDGGMRYFRGAYSLPVGTAGTKLGVAYTGMNYTLGQDFAALNANGTSSIGSLFAVHPILRSRNANFFATANFDSKRIKDNQNGINTADKGVNVFSLGLSGDSRDGYGGGGMTSGSLTVSGGNITLDNANFNANDAITAQTSGGYGKLAYGLTRLQRVDDDWALYVAFSGQAANKNLDSSEKFVLGGMGVRAYPQGEAAGDEGQLLNLEARYNVPGLKLQLTGFFDVGRVTLHKNTWNGWQPVGLPNFSNSYNLAGYGVGANFYEESSFTIRASLAWKLGTNPGASAMGLDSDNNNTSPRLWLQATKQF